MKNIFKDTAILPTIMYLKYDVNETGDFYDLTIEDRIDITRNGDEVELYMTRTVKDEKNEALDLCAKIRSLRKLKNSRIENDEILKFLLEDEECLKRESRLISATISQMTLNTGFGGIITLPYFDEPQINIKNKQD